MKILETLKATFEHEQGQNFVRFCKVVDVFPSSRQRLIRGIIASIFIIPERRWYRVKSERQIDDIVVNFIEEYQNKPKQKPRRMDYQKPYQGKKLTDNSKMPYGKHQGERMMDVPASYLIWCFENNKCSPAVAFYVSENLDTLRKQVSNAKKGIR